jgi:oxaloacetate decarboxylase (Na+ extruding) subunit alpha
MPRLVDTTLRLLGQEPLAGAMPAGELLRLAEILDGAGFAYLEVSGGGCFDSAVRRGVESPWERIRSLKARTQTPLALALRGRFLVGSRPVSVDVVRRFVAIAAESGIDVFRLHDPLNDVSNLTEAAEAITAADREFDAGLVYSPGGSGGVESVIEKAARLPELGAARVLVHDSSGSLDARLAAELVAAVRETSGLPVGLYLQGAAGVGLSAALEAVRSGADLVASAIYPLALTLHRVSGESAAQALSGLGYDTGIDVEALWRASELVDEHIGDEPVSPIPPRVATRAAEHNLPPGLVAGLDLHLRANAAGDRIDEVLEELQRIRAEAGWPPLAAPIGQILASQALIHVLSASRYQTVVDELRALLAGKFGTPPAPIDQTVARAVRLVSAESPADSEPELDDFRVAAQGLAASEEDLLLLALHGELAEPLLKTIRGRGQRDETDATAGLEPTRAERIREIVRIVQESGVSQVTVEDASVRVTVKRSDEQEGPAGASTAAVVDEPRAFEEPRQAENSGLARVEAPMVGTFYRAAEPGAPPFVTEGDAIVTGQTLCILEAMKLMNEVKAETEGVVRTIHVENGQPVEYGQLLFELELVDGRPPAV